VTFYGYQPGRGCTTAAMNTALLLAMAGQKVLLWDWNLKCPGIEEFPYFSGQTTAGFASIIRGEMVPNTPPLGFTQVDDLLKKAVINIFRGTFDSGYLGFLPVYSSYNPENDRRLANHDWMEPLNDTRKKGGFEFLLRIESALNSLDLTEYHDPLDFIIIDAPMGCYVETDFATALFADILVVLSHEPTVLEKGQLDRIKEKNRLILRDFPKRKPWPVEIITIVPHTVQQNCIKKEQIRIPFVPTLFGCRDLLATKKQVDLFSEGIPVLEEYKKIVELLLKLRPR